MKHACRSQRLLMIPGPVMHTDEVIRALAQPAISQHDPAFLDILDDCVRMLKEITGTEVIRISHVGIQATPELQLRTLRGLANTLNRLGYKCEAAFAEERFRTSLQATSMQA